tara:strand:+ start:237 stop:356 length:120 start_codon:yes stop_codon:yes gene_type:complete
MKPKKEKKIDNKIKKEKNEARKKEVKIKMLLINHFLICI